jgi:hypothetical protein
LIEYTHAILSICAHHAPIASSFTSPAVFFFILFSGAIYIEQKGKKMQ